LILEKPLIETPWYGARAAAFAAVLVVITAPVTGFVIEPPVGTS